MNGQRKYEIVERVVSSAENESKRSFNLVLEPRDSTKSKAQIHFLNLNENYLLLTARRYSPEYKITRID